MRKYEQLIAEAVSVGVKVFEFPMPRRIKGLYADGIMSINSRLNVTGKACAAAEELGHHLKTHGNILDQSKLENRKQERLARTWAFQRMIGLDDLIRANAAGVRNRYELAQFLDVTESFLAAALDRLQTLYGIAVYHNDYLIKFDPLQVLEPFSIQ